MYLSPSSCSSAWLKQVIYIVVNVHLRYFQHHILRICTSNKIIAPNKGALNEIPGTKLHRWINHHELPFGSKNNFEFMNCPATTSKLSSLCSQSGNTGNDRTALQKKKVTVFTYVWLKTFQRILVRKEFVPLNTLHCRGTYAIFQHRIKRSTRN